MKPPHEAGLPAPPPLVSIGLPTRDSARFLGPRLDSILAQTMDDWELVVLDGESGDGTWEMLEELAAKDRRVTLERSKPEGIYPAFNRCVERSRGRYVYIATSDDTMAPDCLEKMVGLLERNPDCGLAHCPLRIIDPEGSEIFNWWSRHSLFALSSREWIGRRHKRIAPHDGLLCLLGDNIFSSVTQLLIRRELFDRVGPYRADWGSVGDFHWNLRAGLVANTIHVPDTWASWRMHDAQATAGIGLGSAEHRRKIEAMIADVLGGPKGLSGIASEPGTAGRIERRARELRGFLTGFQRRHDTARRRAYVLARALAGSRPAWKYLLSLLPGRNRWPRSAPDEIRAWTGRETLIPIEA